MKTTETKTCMSCSSPRQSGMFCAPCSRCAIILEIIRTHWVRSEIAGLVSYASRRGHRTLAGDPATPAMIRRLARTAIDIGVTPEEWQKTIIRADKWSTAELAKADKVTIPEPSTEPELPVGVVPENDGWQPESF